jgi:2-polyprenyl-3-methyl-5-hydroxy-6-metoxy-1,4-benzoquinol methylase
MRSRFSSYEKIAHHVPLSGSVLDLGAGFGMLAIYLALSSGKRQVKGVDISNRRIGIARSVSEDIPNVFFERIDVSKADLGRNDCILLIDILHYFPGTVQNKILKRCFNSVDAGGTVIVRDSNRDHRFRQSITTLYETVMTKSGFTKGEGLFFRRFCELKKVAEDEGLSVHVIPMWGRTPFADTLMICRKEPL